MNLNIVQTIEGFQTPKLSKKIGSAVFGENWRIVGRCRESAISVKFLSNFVGKNRNKAKHARLYFVLCSIKINRMVKR